MTSQANHLQLSSGSNKERAKMKGLDAPELLFELIGSKPYEFTALILEYFWES